MDYTVHGILQATILEWVAFPTRQVPRLYLKTPPIGHIYFCFIDYAKAFDCVDHNKLWKILQKMGIPDHLTCLLRNLYSGQEATIKTGHGTTTDSKLGKSICCHNAYLTYIECTSSEMLDWIKHMLESRLLGEISVTSDKQRTPSLQQKTKKN